MTLTRTSPAQLVVLAKSPVPGRVKTRLTPPFTPAEAAGLARAALADTLRAAGDADVERVVLALDGEVGDWLPPGVDVRRQRGGSLDERIARALAGAWAETRLPTLLVGMDTPQLTGAMIDDAVRRLTAPGVDAVLGPAVDGGYWAIGVREPRLSHVVSVPMSRGDTGARQLEHLQAHGLEVRLLATLCDVDQAADADAVAREAPDSAFAAELGRISAGAA